MRAPRFMMPLRSAAVMAALALVSPIVTAQQARPDWCDHLPRPVYSQLTRVLPQADWFEVYEVRDGVFAIYEPHQFQEVISYLIVGSQRALLLDTGMGISPIRPVVERLTDLPVTVVNSHTHHDHVGGNWEFDRVVGVDHDFSRGAAAGWPNRVVAVELAPAALCRDLPGGVSVDSYAIRPFQIDESISGGTVLALGGRQVEVIAIPGHTPDSLALLDREAGLLFTGDTFYEGPIYLFGAETDLAAYSASVERLATLVPELELLLPAHNTPAADPRLLGDLDRAVKEILSGEIEGVIEGERVGYEFDGFLLVLARARRSQ